MGGESKVIHDPMCPHSDDWQSVCEGYFCDDPGGICKHDFCQCDLISKVRYDEQQHIKRLVQDEYAAGIRDALFAIESSGGES